MKSKFLLTLGFVTIFFFPISGIFTLLSLPMDNIVFAQPEEEEEETLQARPVPYTKPDPTSKTGKAIILETQRDSKTSLGSKAAGGASRSMGRTPDVEPGGPVMKPGSMIRTPAVGPVGPAQQSIKGSGNVKYDGVDGESMGGMQQKKGIAPMGVSRQPMGAPGRQKVGRAGGMPTDLQQRQQIQQKLAALGFQVAQVIPVGQGKWRVKVSKFDELKASPALRGGITRVSKGQKRSKSIGSAKPSSPGNIGSGYPPAGLAPGSAAIGVDCGGGPGGLVGVDCGEGRGGLVPGSGQLGMVPRGAGAKMVGGGMAPGGGGDTVGADDPNEDSAPAGGDDTGGGGDPDEDSAPAGGGEDPDDGEYGDMTLYIGFTSSGSLTIGAAGLSQAGFSANAGKLQANGVMLQ
ncbi:MAG: hypothetical protein QNK27_07210 [Desulfuromusa sp.]|nr:hypothetical protein [Desulfuromusa sp.]